MDGWRFQEVGFGNDLEMGTRKENDPPSSAVGTRRMKVRCVSREETLLGVQVGRGAPFGPRASAHTLKGEKRETRAGNADSGAHEL